VVSLNALDENGTIVYQGTLIRAKRKRWRKDPRDGQTTMTKTSLPGCVSMRRETGRHSGFRWLMQEPFILESSDWRGEGNLRSCLYLYPIRVSNRGVQEGKTW
jgi:hypothetical protein